MKKSEGSFNKKEIIEDLYYNKLMSQNDIADYFNVSKKVISNRFKEFNIKTRSKSWYGINRNTNKSNKTLKERLLERIVVKKSNCWEWQGSTDSCGYGRMKVYQKNHGTHRLSAHVFFNFNLDSKFHVLHVCDNPPCINPDHLYIGTHEDNMKDMSKKGRAVCIWKGKKRDKKFRDKISKRMRGENCHFSKLTEKDVLEIRDMLNTKRYKQKDIAKLFDVHPVNISKIKKRQSWSHI